MYRIIAFFTAILALAVPIASIADAEIAPCIPQTHKTYWDGLRKTLIGYNPRDFYSMYRIILRRDHVVLGKRKDGTPVYADEVLMVPLSRLKEGYIILNIQKDESISLTPPNEIKPFRIVIKKDGIPFVKTKIGIIPFTGAVPSVPDEVVKYTEEEFPPIAHPVILRKMHARQTPLYVGGCMVSDGVEVWTYDADEDQHQGYVGTKFLYNPNNFIPGRPVR